MFSNSNNANPVAAFFKMQRGVIGITFPERILFSREFLRWRRQRVETLPETLISPADHGRS